MKQILNTDLDAFDLAILRIVQRDNKTPQREIAEAVNLSTPSVQRRLKRLEESGVIASNVAIIDPERVGLPITIIAEVELVSESAEQIDAAKQQFVATPEIQQCYYVTGNADFVLVITVASMAAYETLTRSLFFENNNVRRFETLVSMDRVKTGMAIAV